MLGVKFTVLLIVLTVIWKFVAEILIKGESMEKKIGIAMNNEVTWYMVVFAVLAVASVLGVLYSVFYLLFLR
jgi:hypothetical protein